MVKELMGNSVGLRSTFVWRRVGGVMTVKDCDDGTVQLFSVSVTNDAENVVKFLAQHADLTDDEPLVYQDTTGRWDEIVHQDGQFVDFELLGCKSQEAAIQAVKMPPLRTHGAG